MIQFRNPNTGNVSYLFPVPRANRDSLLILCGIFRQSLSLFGPVAIQIWDVRWGQSGHNNYMPPFTFFWGGQYHNTFLFIISFYLQLPSEVGRANTIIPHFRNEEAEAQKFPWLVQGHSLAEQGLEVRSLFPSPTLLSMKHELLRKGEKEVKVIVIYRDFLTNFVWLCEFSLISFFIVAWWVSH